MAEAADRIDLAGLADFPLGGLVVSPSTARVRSGSRAHRLEPRVMQVLVALARRPGQTVSRDELIEACWEGRIVSDDAVARVIAQLRSLARDLDPPAFGIETLPKVGFRLIVEGVDPVAAALAPTATPTATATGELRLAVLPFDNLGGDPAMDHVVDGVAEEILYTLAQRAGLSVVSRASSFQFRGPQKALDRVAAALQVTHVIDGAVRVSGTTVRVTAQLVGCATGSTLWSHRAEAELGQVMALQETMAAEAAAALSHAVSTYRRARAVDPKAVDLYLRARTSTERWLGGGDADLLAEAVALAPGFASAWASLALTRSAQAMDVLLPPAKVASLHAEASAAADRALALDPGAPAAHLARNLLEPFCGAFEAGDGHIASALAHAPQDPWVLFHAAQSAESRGRLNEALGYAERARRIEPFWPQGRMQHAILLNDTGRTAEADAEFDAVRARWPHLDYPPISALYRATYSERWTRAEALAASLRRDGPHGEPTAQALQRFEARRRGDRADSLEVLERERRRVAETGTMSLNIAVLCNDGLSDAAYDLVERASFAHLFEPTGRRVHRDLGLIGLFFAHGRAMRADRRFVRLCGKLGLAAYWLRTGRWPDCAQETPYDFAAECRRVAN